MKTLGVLVHRTAQFWGPENYYLAHALKLLETVGAVSVRVWKGPPSPTTRVNFTHMAQHVDLTHVPPEYLAAMQSWPCARVLNGAVQDISKRKISEQLLEQGSTHQGPVIVKPNLNYGGRREALAWPLRHSVLSQMVFPEGPKSVPAHVWADPELVVEPFTPELAEPGVYVLRMWKFCLGAETLTLAYSRNPIVKSSTVFHREEISPELVPWQIRAARARLGFDFGKFDFAVVDGAPVLFDANKTPTITRPMPEEMDRVGAFAQALRGWL